VVGHKCHAKMMMIVRREEGTIRRYVHLGTGNYHTGTSRLYTDFSFMTASPDIGEDVHNVFMQLTSLGKINPMRCLLQSPFTLKTTLLSLIEAEADAARNGRAARIRAKLNGLSEPIIIQALYEASQAGVKIDLVVRGICCLRPGIPGLSENITVRSILGRFLEHARVYHFHAEGSDLVFTSSADWMDRNLNSRVEVATPITSPHLKKRLLSEALDMALADNTHAWILQRDGQYTRLNNGRTKATPLQQALLSKHSR
jgi:polyphosphate kinase